MQSDVTSRSCEIEGGETPSGTESGSRSSGPSESSSSSSSESSSSDQAFGSSSQVDQVNPAAQVDEFRLTRVHLVGLVDLVSSGSYLDGSADERRNDTQKMQVVDADSKCRLNEAYDGSASKNICNS